MSTPRLSAELSDDRQTGTVDAERRDVHAQHLVGFDDGPGLDGEEVTAGGEQFLDNGGREAPLGEIAVFVVAAGWHGDRSYVLEEQAGDRKRQDAALVAVGIVIARSHTEWPIDESWIGLGFAATSTAVAIDPLTRRRVEIRPTVRVIRTTRTADPDTRLVGDNAHDQRQLRSPGR